MSQVHKKSLHTLSQVPIYTMSQVCYTNLKIKTTQYSNENVSYVAVRV